MTNLTAGSASTENFDSLAASGENATLPADWFINETGTSKAANGLYIAGTGSGNAGDTYSFGSAGSSDRALGGLLSGTLTPIFGASFTNDTGAAITSLLIAYTGEQWRLGTVGRADRLDFQISFDATSLTTGTWTDVDQLDFVAPVTAGTVGALDGNAAANQTAVSATLAANVADGATFWIRWNDFNAASSDDGLAVDNFSITANPGPAGAGTFSIAGASAAESAGFVELKVTRTGGAAGAATLDFSVSAGTATADDFAGGTLPSGQVTFADGETEATIKIAVANDAQVEADETFTVTLANTTAGTIGTAAATGKILNDDAQNLAIYQIQGEAHKSAYAGQSVTTSGIVTAVGSNGFYLQDAAGDGNARTSDAIFVFTSSAPTVQTGYEVSVTGKVEEFLPGGNASNLSTTEIVASALAITKDAGGNAVVHALPDAVLIGTGGLVPPSDVFDNDQFATYDPENDAADFFESLEGMRVTVDAPTVVDRTNQFGETYVVASNGTGATGLNSRGGITISGNSDGFDDYNPERIQLDDSSLFAGFKADYTQGDQLNDVTGIMSYDFQSYELLVTETVTVSKAAAEPSREVTALVGDATHLTMATYNVENLDPSDDKFDILADDIVFHLRAPDIIALQEIQDGDGAGNGADLSGYVTAQGLIDAIAAIGGPDYVYIEITPSAPGTTGGEPGGNIRNGFLYNPDRVDYVDGSAESITGAAFTNSRSPIAATFNFNGEDVTAISVHSSSRGGSDPLFGATQPPVNGAEAARIAQSEAIRDYVEDLIGADTEARVAVLGDFNGFYFEQSIELLEQGGLLTDLHRTIPEEERYSYMFGGNAQALDHMLVSGALLNGAQFDPVHINAEQADTAARGTDHDPLVASFEIAAPAAPLEVDLSQYVRVGRFDLPEPTRTTAPAGSVLAQEVSAVTYNWDTDTLFVVGDGGTSIVQISKTGQLIDSMTLAPGGSPQNTEFYDPEGLAYIGNGKFVMTEERDRNAVQFTYAAGTTLTRADAETTNLGSNVGNVGLEGLTYDPLTGGYIFVKEKDPQSIFQTKIDFATDTVSNVNSTNLFDPTGLNVIDLADVYALSNLSTIATTHEGNLLVLSQESAKIFEVDRNGTILSWLDIHSDAGNPLDVVSQQHEGVAMDKEGNLYVVSENGGGDFDHPQLWVYAPSKVPNAAPTAISLTNATTAIDENTSTVARIKVADVGITDDGLGNNKFSVAGTDAQFFEVDSTGLYIKAGTTLDYETQQTYSVTVSVDDANVGATPDASTAFTLNVTDLKNESTLPSIYISEVAPWSSGNSPVSADWFEITNGGSKAIDLTGWKMDDGSNSFAVAATLNGVTSLAPSQSAIFFETATPATAIATFIDTWFGGNAPAGVQFGSYSGGGVGLSTGGDGVSLFNAAGVLQANVSFGSSPNGPFSTFDNAAGLNNATISTLSLSGVHGAFNALKDTAEVGSPGTVGRLIVSEVAPWSSGESPVGADWFELTNTTAFAIDITGWKVDDSSGSPAAAVALNGITSIAPGESVIFIESNAPASARAAFIDTWFGGNAPAGLQIGTYTGSGIGLSTSGDAVNIYDGSNKLQASVAFGASPTGTFPTFDNAAGLNNATIATLSLAGTNGAFNATKHTTEVGSPGEIVAVNDTPVAVDDDLSSVDAGAGARTISFASLLGNDKAGPVNESAQTLTITQVSNAVGGSVSIVGSDVIFTPTAGFTGKASFDYTARDNGTTYRANDFLTDVGTARFDIVKVNTAPTDLVIDKASIAENSAAGELVGTLSAKDVAGDVLTYSLVDNAGDRFAVDAATGALTATKAFDYEAETTFTVVARVQDQTGLMVDKSIAIAVTDVNEAPVATKDAVAVLEDATTANLWSQLLANDSDPDAGTTLRISAVNTAATLGTVEFDEATKTLRYIADDDSFDALANGAEATDSFSYTVIDDNGLTSTATVTVTVTGTADGVTLAGTVRADTLVGTAGEDLIGGLVGNDRLDGLDGHDKLWGGVGNDKLFGGAGNDMLSGDLGNDELDGGDGDDNLFGDLGNDLLIGGAGHDTFGFILHGGNATIADFNVAEDQIMLGFGVSVSKAKVSDVNKDDVSDLTLTFGLGGSVTLLGVSNYAAVHIERGDAFISQSPF